MSGEKNKKEPILDGERVTIFLKGKKYVSTVIPGRMALGNHSISGKTLIGRPFGRQEVAGLELLIMPPSIVDHMDTLIRGPQVILSHDAANILFLGNVNAGKTALEAGSGSGSLTMALASAVGDHGKVVSVDTSHKNSEIARKNVKRARLIDRVTFLVGDVRVHEEIRNLLDGQDIVGVDTIILDMPDPWEAVETALDLLSSGGILITYLPTMNQVERFRLRIEGADQVEFTDVITSETIKRDLVVKEGAVRPDYAMLGHTGYITVARRI